MTIKKIYKSSWFVKVVFVVCLFSILFIAGLGYKHISNVSKSQRLLQHTHKVNIELEQILSYLKDAETGQRGYIITQDSIYLEPFFKSSTKINSTFAALEQLTKANLKQQDNLKDLRVVIDKRLLNFEQSNYHASQLNPNQDKFNTVFLEGKILMDAIRAKLNSMILLENNRLLEHQKAYQTHIKFTPVFLYGLIVFTLLLMYITYVKINNSLEELKKKNQELEVFKESTNQSEIINKHGSWRWNVEDDTFHFSDNLFRLLGEAPQSFKHSISNFMRFVHPDDINKLSNQVEQMKLNKDLPFIRYRVVHKDGTIHYLKAYGKSIINTAGKTQLLGTTTDITDEIDAFNTLEQRNQELELNNKELAAFNYVASHDLQEPLRKIQTFLSRLESTNLTDKGKVYIERIHVSATRMRLLIDDLLQYSRTNKSTELLKESDVNIILEDAIQDLAEQITSTRAKIDVPVFPLITVIPFQIQQLFLNLISNALKYSLPNREVELSITHQMVLKVKDKRLANGYHDAYHKITFKDNGIGFKQEYAKDIFELFNRLHNKDEYSGTGIGLSICKKITDNHKGFIFAKGEPNVGATFAIFLPNVS